MKNKVLQARVRAGEGGKAWPRWQSFVNQKTRVSVSNIVCHVCMGSKFENLIHLVLLFATWWHE
jgi:hypothetical protein